jgi:hypothetical protein
LLDCKVLLEDISGKRLDLDQRPTRIGDVKHTLADISMAKSEFDYNPSTDFEEQVSRTAKWYESSYPTPAGGLLIQWLFILNMAVTKKQHFSRPVERRRSGGQSRH